MNQQSKWRLGLAKDLTRAYQCNSKVEAVLVGGSVSRGCADAYSDIEIGVFWSEPPSEAERQEPVTYSRGTLWLFHPYRFNPELPIEEGTEESFYVGGDVARGLKVDVHHRLVSSTNSVISDVIDSFDPDLAKQELISTIELAVPLSGAPLIDRWKNKVAVYPDELARAMVSAHLYFNPFFGPAMLTEREHMFIEMFDIINRYQQRILSVLMGLNRIYHRGDYKWVNQTIGQFRIVPDDLAVRLRLAYGTDPIHSWQEMHKLIDETCTLVERNMPELNIERARDWFRIRRQQWHTRPIIKSPSN